MKFKLSVALLLATSVSRIWAQEPLALGPEFQVDNVSTSSSRRLPAVARGADGEFLVVWLQELSVGEQRVYGRKFMADGTPSNMSFRIDSFSTTKNFPAVAALSGGNYIVAWEELSVVPGSDNSGTSVRAKIVGGSGAEFQVNTFSDIHQGRPAVASLQNGDFIVAWQSDGSSGSDHSATSIQAQLFNSNGARVGSEFQVNTYTPGGQAFPAIAAGSEEFVVVWQSGVDFSDLNIRGRRFAVSGQALGDDFQVNVFTAGAQISADVVVGAGGEFTIVWTSGELNVPGPDGARSSIQGRRYDSSGAPVGGEFQVNTQILEDQSDPAIALREGGGFVVLWFDRIEPGDVAFLPGGVRGQLFNANGSPQGAEFALNTYIPNAQDSPDVAVGSGDTFIGVWRSSDQNGDGSGDIVGRRFLGSNYIFGDGFETGDVSFWN